MASHNHTEIDLLIHAKWIVPVVPAGTVLEDHALAVSGRKIVDLLPGAEADLRFQSKTTMRLSQHVLIPGLVNAHGHAPMSLLRGIADDMSLKQWLEQHIWPLEGKLVNEEFVQDGAELAIAEMIHAGTTCFADMYFFPDVVGQAAESCGLRAQLASPVLDFPTVWAADADEYIRKATQLHDDFRNSELVTTAFGPHAPYTVSDEPIRKLAVLAEELEIPVHMHVHETAQEVADGLASTGVRPLARLNKLGMVNPNLVCVHATQLDPSEIDLLAQQAASVVHCPESNLKLASGFCPVKLLQQAGVNVALGTDGAASNNDLDLLSDLRTAALLAKAVGGDASAVPAHQALAMATINGARAL
ncbi:MAG: TRZ/ATZ family hydrolase, partial [Gammaproteobacteria bacterium]